ncbi:MAG: alpha-amylase family glycosyl hydrolase [Kineosporiaceae bacterium]
MVRRGPGRRTRSPARERYHFRDGRGPDGAQPPNDWISSFGGPAWTRTTEGDGRPGQWYLHLFAPQQPDLNWANPQVRAEFEDVVRFWFDLGIDGLRVDAASAFAKHPDLPDHGFRPGDTFSPRLWDASPLWDVDAVHEIFRSWRAIADSYDSQRIFVGEVTVKGADRLAQYLRPDELHTAFNLDYLKSAWTADSLRANIIDTCAAMAEVGAPPTWVLSNHDETRHITRYGREDTAVRDGSAGADADRPSDIALGTRRPAPPFC